MKSTLAVVVLFCPSLAAAQDCEYCLAEIIKESVSAYQVTPVAATMPQASRAVSSCPYCGQEDCVNAPGAPQIQYSTQMSAKEQKALRREQRRQEAREAISEYGLVLVLLKLILGNCGK